MTVNRVTRLRPPKPHLTPWEHEAAIQAAYEKAMRPYADALTARVDAMIDRLLGKDPTP